MSYSHVFGKKSPSLLETDIVARLQEIVLSQKQKTFIISHHQNVSFTYGETWSLVCDFANGLSILGLKEGDRIGIWIPNRWEWIIAQFATALIGVILVTINPAYRSEEFRHAAKLVGLRAVIMQSSFKGSDYFKILDEAGNIPSLQFVIEVDAASTSRSIPFKSLLEKKGNDSHFAWKRLNPDEACNIQFTSGTTGHPKGATLSHRNILNNAHFLGLRMRVTKDDILICQVPLYHCFGCVLGVLCMMSHGGTIVLPSEHFDAGKSIECISKYRGTMLYGVPTMMLEVHSAYMKDSQKYDITKLRGGAMGGSPCPPELMRRMMDDMNMREISCIYGMTETSPISFSTDIEDGLIKRCETVGRVMEHVEVKIVDPSTKSVLEIGQIGEIWTKGYSVMLGYWNQPEKTKESISPDGFMQTGDLGYLDAEGYCRIVGRSKDMIIRGGENIFPAEIENFLIKMPNIQDVSVIGVPDDRMGEEVCAWIKPKCGFILTTQQVHDYCKGKISHYKIPRFVFNVDDFPLTVTGKVRKNEMREITKLWIKNKPHGKL